MGGKVTHADSNAVFGLSVTLRLCGFKRHTGYRLWWKDSQTLSQLRGQTTQQWAICLCHVEMMRLLPHRFMCFDR